MRTLRHIVISTFLAAGLTPPLAAQTPDARIDAQERLRQQERERQLREQQERGADIRLPAPAATPPRAPARQRDPVLSHHPGTFKTPRHSGGVNLTWSF